MQHVPSYVQCDTELGTPKRLANNQTHGLSSDRDVRLLKAVCLDDHLVARRGGAAPLRIEMNSNAHSPALSGILSICSETADTGLPRIDEKEAAKQVSQRSHFECMAC